MGQDPDVAVAIDGMSLEEGVAFVDRLGGDCTWVKVGLELFTRSGPLAVQRFRDLGQRVFLDVKLHDIPNTVAGAVRAASALGADLITVHASGGVDMVGAARSAADDSDHGLRVIAVTVLTSMDAPALAAAWGVDGSVDVSDRVGRLADSAVGAGAHGIVASVHEAGALRGSLPSEVLLVTPGIRLSGDSPDDQARVASPAQAAEAGADLLVVGRSVTRAADPAQALRRVRRELADVGRPA